MSPDFTLEGTYCPFGTTYQQVLSHELLALATLPGGGDLSDSAGRERPSPSFRFARTRNSTYFTTRRLKRSSLCGLV